MSLRSQILNDASSLFFNTDDFAETVTYYPDGDLEAGREIAAIIDRDIQSIDPVENVLGFVTMVRVYDDSTRGISATEINTHRDKLGIAMRVGESQRVRQITRVVSTEHGSVRFEIN
jgi:hypothetical protein